MVLENSSDGASESFSDDKPQSDGDPYAPDSNGVPHVVIDVDQFSRRLTLRSLFMNTKNSTDKLLCATITDRVKHMANTLQRAPSQEEVDAMGFWTSKQLSLQSYSLPIGLGAGSMRAYNTRNTFSFPFYKPDLEKLNTNAFPSSRFALLYGTFAKQAWHCSRWVSYVAAGNVVAGFLTGAYAMSVVAVGEMADPRLKSYVETLRAKAQQRSGRTPQAKQPGPAAGLPQSDNSPSWKSTDDDASPTNESKHDMDTSYSGDAAGTGQYGRTYNRSSTEEIAREARESLKSQTNKGSDDALPMDDSATQDFYQSFDDASPSARRGVADTQRSGGSAWDRIRQQASTGKPPRPVGSGPRIREPAAADENPTDHYSFSSSDRERQTVRDEAQKEFDARVERERRGGDFSSGSGDQKRW